MEIDWSPISYWGAVPINWYGLTYLLGFLAGGALVWRSAPRFGVPHGKVEELVAWIAAGTVLGARLYFVAQNDPLAYLTEPWRIFAVWEGGLAFFGGVFGGTLAGWAYACLNGLSFPRVADLFAPAVPVGAAIGRVSCGLAGMDYGTPTTLPWGVVYTNPASYAPVDGVARHPVQFYELAGDLAIAGVLYALRGRVPQGALFLLYLILFAALRFFLFFARGDVPAVGLGLKNGQWTALAILAVAVPMLWLVSACRRRGSATAAAPS